MKEKDLELYHYGIPGMRWGVRRFQKPDGTLTAAGRARYNTDGRKKNAADMDDDDLARSNKRLQAEFQFNQLSGRPYRNRSSKTDRTVKAGASAVGSFVAVSGAVLLKDYFSGNNVSMGKAVAPGIIAAIGGAVGSITTSYGGQVKKGGI